VAGCGAVGDSGKQRFFSKISVGKYVEYLSALRKGPGYAP